MDIHSFIETNTKLFIANEIQIAKDNNRKLSYIDIGEQLGIFPGMVKKEVKYIRSLDATLGNNPVKYFDKNCRDESPKKIMAKIKLLPKDKQGAIVEAYYLWRKEYLKAKGEL